jgi:hypothetical protein
MKRRPQILFLHELAVKSGNPAHMIKMVTGEHARTTVIIRPRLPSGAQSETVDREDEDYK